jgi:photosystem II stability/assembly factor-like uncharacterized protein
MRGLKKMFILLVLGMVPATSLVGLVLAQEGVWENISDGIIQARAIIIHKQGVIYLGTEKGLYKTEDGGGRWRLVFSGKGPASKINFLAVDSQDNLYVATGNGLFLSYRQGRDYRLIFRGKTLGEKDCRTLAIGPQDKIYLGTRAGLFMSKDKGRIWHRAEGELSHSQILAITIDEAGGVYVACSRGVFKSQGEGRVYMRIFVGRQIQTEDSQDDSYENEDEDEEPLATNIRYIVLHPLRQSEIWLATDSGVYFSKDAGESWRVWPDFGLLDRDVKVLAISDYSPIYALTDSAVFVYKKDRWHEVSLGLAAEKMKFLALDEAGNIYVATNKGLFKSVSPAGYFSFDGIDATGYFKTEPTIKEMQQAAIDYAEVSPRKILSWRRKAAKRALLPKLTVGIDKDNNRTISKSIWGSATQEKHYVGPDDETAYKNYNFNISVTWELADLIYNEHQTSIDVRSRLMVQLRDDILDEVNKTYFERRRLKTELLLSPPKDRKEKLQKQIRLEELTASLDALTGGYFSDYIESCR